MTFFKKGLTHDFGPKMAIFPTFFFLGNIGQENDCYDILEQKNAFLGYENKESGFGPKMAIFSTFFLFDIGQENGFYDILQRKNAFLAYKNKKSKKSKN